MLVKNLSKILFYWLCSFLLFSAVAEDTTEEDPDQKVMAEPQQMITEESDQILEKDLSLTLALSGEPYKCRRLSDCEKICEEIYSRRAAENECLDLHPDQVKRFDKIYKTLESPNFRDLIKIAPEDLENFVKIDYRPLKKLTEKLSNQLGARAQKAKQAKQVLTWIVENPLIAKIFHDEDDDFLLLTSILRAINFNLKEALRKELRGKIYSDSFMGIAIHSNVEALKRESRPADALEWVHSFFSKECSYNSSREKEKVCILQDWYCKVGLNEEHHWDDLLLYEEFEDVINDILDRYDISGHKPSWWDHAKHQEKEAEDLWGKQVEDLCGKILVKKR